MPVLTNPGFNSNRPLPLETVNKVSTRWQILKSVLMLSASVFDTRLTTLQVAAEERPDGGVLCGRPCGVGWTGWHPDEQRHARQVSSCILCTIAAKLWTE